MADTTIAMSKEPTLAEQELLADTRRRAGSRLGARERRAELLLGASFVAGVAGLWLAQPPHHLALTAGLWCLPVFVLASRVTFETPFGFTVATQLAFVPLLFALPVAAVPVAVVLGLALARVPDVAARRLPPVKLAQTLGNSWFCLGPCWVFALAGAHVHAGAAVLAGALLAQFATDFAASALYLWITGQATVRSHLRATWVYGIDAALSGVSLLVAQRINVTPWAILAVVPLLGVLAMFARERTGRLENLLELNETYRGTARLLGDVISADDDYTGAHSDGVVGLSMAVGEALGLGAERQRNLEFAAQLHDLGKISIPNELINKPGALDPDEWALIKTHTVAGEQMLRRVGGFMHDVGRIVRAHHERWDGQGYPDGMAGEAIPLEARIISVCDSWSAMRTDRSYRMALSHEVAVAEMRANAGTQFDPRVVEALLGTVGDRVPALERQIAPVADHEAVVGAVEAQDRGQRDVAGDAKLVP